MVHINGWFTLGAAVATNSNLNIAICPTGITPANQPETFSVATAYDEYATCLIYYNNGHLQLYKPTKSLPSGRVVSINMCYKALT